MTGNLFLDTLPAATAERLLPRLTRRSLERGEVLSHPGVAVDELFFPIRSLLSTITRMADGSAVEVGIAGLEGMSSLSLAFGNRVSPHSTIVQIADSAYSTSAQYFAEQIDVDAELRARVLCYAQYTFIAATQFAACNRLHPMEQRYARWLLMADDRVGNGEIALTQEYSAQMLGVRRAGVTITAGEMSNSGLISYRRGHVTVLDRHGLEATACECYNAVNDTLKALMGYDIKRNGPAVADEANAAKQRDAAAR